MDATIFYAWQSDRPAKVNRYLIRDAAKTACERITDDGSNSWSVTLDSDTQGVAGMCDIPNTILDKIERCDIFLADLTFVGITEESVEPRQIPNANVLFELGYAAKCLDFDVLVGVVNEAFGTIEGQVFDIKRRASLTYNMVSDAAADDRKKECDKLSRQLEEVFRTTLDTVVAQRRAQASRNTDVEFRRLQTECSARLLEGNFHGFRKRPATLITIQSNASVPMFDDLFEEVRAKGLNPKPHEKSIDWSGNFQATELGLNGVLFHVYGGDYESFKNGYAFTMHSRLNNTGAIPPILRAVNVQANIVRHVHKHCHLLRELGLASPWRVGVSLVGTRGFQLLVGNDHTTDAAVEDEIHLPPCVISDLKKVVDFPTTATALRDTLDRLCRCFGLPRSSCFDSDGNWSEEFQET